MFTPYALAEATQIPRLLFSTTQESSSLQRSCITTFPSIGRLLPMNTLPLAISRLLYWTATNYLPQLNSDTLPLMIKSPQPRPLQNTNQDINSVSLAPASQHRQTHGQKKQYITLTPANVNDGSFTITERNEILKRLNKAENLEAPRKASYQEIKISNETKDKRIQQLKDRVQLLESKVTNFGHKSKVKKSKHRPS